MSVVILMKPYPAQSFKLFVLYLDPGKLNPVIDVEAFCERWELSIGNFYKSLGDLKNRGVVEAITNQLNLRIQET
ncbi:hypothetical protein ACN4EK_24190 [Pantanalinema rosaneae CENA516]|uniref:hypothetical protein n=1 Tax=Pantanalinema rosaneae TaxID=1620701 RepID=UPI003D6F43F1